MFGLAPERCRPLAQGMFLACRKHVLGCIGSDLIWHMVVVPKRSRRGDVRFFREGFRMPARWDGRSGTRGPASESLRRTNPRDSDGVLAGYGDLVARRHRRRMILHSWERAESRF